MNENGHDPKLSGLLAKWRAPAVPGNFEANVWRRIRVAGTEPEHGFAGWWRALWHPAFSVTIAVALGIAIGVWCGVFSTPTVPSPASTSVLAPGSLAGTYAQLTTGD